MRKIAFLLLSLLGAAQAQNRSVSVSGSVNLGAVAGVANIGHYTTGAGGWGRDVAAQAYAGKNVLPGFTSTFANGSAYARRGGVVTTTTTPVGTASAGANGNRGLNVWSSGGKSITSDGTNTWLNSSASAGNGGAWAAVEGNWGSAVGVAAGKNASAGVTYQNTPTYSGGKG